MITSISASKHIYLMLKENEKLRKLVGNNIFPIVAEETAQFPFVVFTRESSNGVYTKDLLCYDEAFYSISVVAKNYSETCEILEIIREIFDCLKTKIIYQMKVDKIIEDYIDSAFVLTIIFNCQIKPIETN